ncbi:MAG: hypothetical protein JO340_12840 [Acidobacteriaceae bacterium]|nr:hypothetical protein [Acidobacteriaceae bacterium]
MPKQGEPANGKVTSGQTSTTAYEKVANLLALSVVKGLPVQEQVARLNGAGFTNAEISKLLGMKPNTVAVALYNFKKQPTRWGSGSPGE